eukprot:s224_g23.t1
MSSSILRAARGLLKLRFSGQEGAVPELVEVVQLPCAIVCGGVSLDLYPRGIQEEFITLPWEIVEACHQEARESCDDLLQSISAILSKEDSLRRIGGMEIEDCLASAATKTGAGHKAGSWSHDSFSRLSLRHSADFSQPPSQLPSQAFLLQP